MSRAILGKKLGMTRIFDAAGQMVPVTVVEAGPCRVLQKRTRAKHGYSAIQIGFGEVAGHRLNKPDRGPFEKLEVKPMRHLREVRMTPEEVDQYNRGDPITVGIFSEGEWVDIVGTSKGRGFQGVVKRYHFAGFTKTRGTHEYRRHPGSIGMREHPGKVLKGKRLPGHMGDRKVTIQNIRVAKVDAESNLLMVQGSVPGPRGSVVMIQKAVKRNRLPKA